MSRLATVVFICATVVAVAACGDDDDGSEPASEKKAAQKVSNPAKGSPVLLGVVAVKGEPEFEQGVEAAVKYLNEEANGLLGHRIETRTCVTDPSPQQTIECANEMVSADAVAVVMGGDFLSDAAFPIYEKAGLPVLGERVLGNQQLVSPVSIALGPGILGSLAAFAGYIKDELEGEKVVTVSRPAPKAVKGLVDAPLTSAGLTNEWAVFSNENPDFTATFAAAAEKDPDVLLLSIDDNAQCIPAMNAVRSVAADAKAIQISCSDDLVLEEAGTAADGQLFYGGLDSIAGADSPDTRIFNHIVEAYGRPEVDGFNGAAGVSPTVTLARVLDEQGGKQVTRKSVLKAFADSKGVTRFMGPPLECGEFKYPRMCTASLRIFTIEGGKKKVLTDWISYPQYVR